MKRVVLNLTEAEAAAILRSDGLHAGHGVALSAALRSANMKLIGAVAASSAPGPQVEEPMSERLPRPGPAQSTDLLAALQASVDRARSYRLAMNQPNLSYCEQADATLYTQVHIREVGPEGLFPRGGIPGAALCGAVLLGGWDLPHAVSLEALQPAMVREVNPLCPACAGRAAAILTAAEQA